MNAALKLERSRRNNTNSGDATPHVQDRYRTAWVYRKGIDHPDVARPTRAFLTASVDLGLRRVRAKYKFLDIN